MDNRQTIKQHTPWLQQKLEAIWYKKKPGKLLLLPLTALFCLFSNYKKKRDQKHQIQFEIPVIIIGNINVGGTGKTPLVIRLTEILKDNGYMPCIITRGYKGNAKQWPVMIDKNTPASLAGDEAKLIAIRSGVPVIAGPDRNADIKFAIQNTVCNILLSDDGLQHYKMKRDIEIAVVDAQRRYGNGYCLPAGPLREPPERLNECDFIICNGKPIFANENLMQVKGSVFINLTTKEKKPINKFTDIQIYTGIGNPQRFVDSLESHGLNITNQFVFADHHHFRTTDFKNQNNHIPIIMTEKDAVKCSNLGLENCWYMPINAQLEKSFERLFLVKILTLQ
jgi:tetraacyldisaccharide 4'-kinase